MDLKERREIGCLNRHPWETSRGEVIRDILKDKLKADCRILDIGCGDLFLEEYLSGYSRECQFFCVDIAYSEEEVERLNRKYENVRVYNTLEAFRAEHIEVDVVLLLDVIEHIEDDKAFLRELIRYPFVTSATSLLISVPAFQALYTSHDTFLGHYRRYNLKKLRNLVREVGLKDGRCGYFYLALLLPRFLQLLKEKLSGVHQETTGLVEWHGGAGITRFLCRVLTLDYRVGKVFNQSGIQLPGLSAYVLCQKEVVL